MQVETEPPTGFRYSLSVCVYEALLLMHERWRRLHADFYNAKKDTFDISKAP